MALVAAPTADATTMTSDGPLTTVGVSPDLNCSVNHVGDSNGEFYGSTACGTLVATGGTLYGPANIPAGSSASPRVTYTAVDQSAVTGDGTTANPYSVTTTVDLGDSGLRLTETDRYVVGEWSYRTNVQLTNNGSSAASAIVYRAADCYLGDSVYGFGSHDVVHGGASCVNAVIDSNTGVQVPGSRVEQFLPISAGSHSLEAFYGDVWSRIGAQLEFDDTCRCDEQIDNGAGLSWAVTVPAGASVTRASAVSFTTQSSVTSESISLSRSGTRSEASNGWHALTALVQDGSGHPLVDEPVTFSVTGGPNQGVSGIRKTNAYGKAIFGYGSTSTGTDTIQASFSGTSGTVTSDPVTHTWEPAVLGTFGGLWNYSASPLEVRYSYPGGHYAFNVSQGALNWNNSGAHVHVAARANTSDPVNITFEDVEVNDTWWGLTLFTADCERCDYSQNGIQMNRRMLDGETQDQRAKVATHEIGHAIGLEHPLGIFSLTEPSVMWQGRLNAYVKQYPQAIDVSRVDQEYP